MPDLGGVRAGARGKDERLSDRFDRQRDDDLIGDLAGLAVAVPAHEGDVLPHGLEQGLGLFERLPGAAAHDGQRRVLRADLAARHRRVDIVASELVDPLGEGLGRDGRDRAHVDHQLVRRKPCGDAIGREENGFDVGRIRNHDDHNIAASGAPDLQTWPPEERSAGTPPRLNRLGS